MSGRYYSSVRFPLHLSGCKSSRLQVEPLLCLQGFGISVKIILTLTKGTGETSRLVEECVFQEFLTQEDIPHNGFAETFYDFMEGFYYSKVTQDVGVPIVALLLTIHFPEILKRIDLDLSEYVHESHKKDHRIGF